MRVITILAAIAAVLCVAPASADVKNACSAPASLTQLDLPLSHTAAKLTAKQPVTIVAIGSSSTAGAGASAPSNSYPSRLVIALAARFPDAGIKVLNRGVNGEVEDQMEARFTRDVLSQHPDLVIWQVGTNSVIRDRDISAYQPALERGIARLKASGADVVIMDLQYAPKVLAHRGYENMLRKIDAAARDENVAVFRRFAIMQHWIASGRLDFASILSPDQLHMNDLSYRCIANLLADAIGGATETPLLSSAVPARAASGVPEGAGKRHEINLPATKTAVETSAQKK
jgi:lysophospholipase L1-like esterase